MQQHFDFSMPLDLWLAIRLFIGIFAYVAEFSIALEKVQAQGSKVFWYARGVETPQDLMVMEMPK